MDKKKVKNNVQQIVTVVGCIINFMILINKAQKMTKERERERQKEGQKKERQKDKETVR